MFGPSMFGMLIESDRGTCIFPVLDHFGHVNGVLTEAFSKSFSMIHPFSSPFI